MILASCLNQATPLVPFPELVPVFGDTIDMYNVRKASGVDEMVEELKHFLAHTSPGAHDSEVSKWNSYLWDCREAMGATVFNTADFEDWSGEDISDEGKGIHLARLGYRLPTLAEVLFQYQTYNNWRLMVLQENNLSGMYFDGLVLNAGTADEGAWRGKQFSTKSGGYLIDDNGDVVTLTLGFPNSDPYEIGPEAQWGTNISGEYISYRERLDTLSRVGYTLRNADVPPTYPVTASVLQGVLGLDLFSELFSGGTSLTSTRWWGIPGAAWNKHTYMLGDREVEMLKKYGG